MRLFTRTPKTTPTDDILAQIREMGARIDAELEAQRRETLARVEALTTEMAQAREDYAAGYGYWDWNL